MRLRMSPVGSGDGAAAVMVAASAAVYDRMVQGIARRFVAVMRALTAAARMLGRDRGLQSDRKDRSDKRKQQQQSGGQALHVFPVNQNPEVGRE